MPNPLFNAIMSGFKPPVNSQGNSSPMQSQTPTAAPNAPQMNFQDAMKQLRSNPAQLMKQAGFNVPDEIASNPQASVMHLIQSGQVGGPMMQRIQPMLSRLMGGRGYKEDKNMKEKLENKIEAIVEFIISKPESKITQEDYNILSSELRDIRFRESQADSGKRMAELMAIAYPGFSAYGDVK